MRERGVRAELRLVSATGQEVLPHTSGGRGMDGPDRPVPLAELKIPMSQEFLARRYFLGK